ncbi:MAG: SDR family oxidoreductase [Oligoflexia bacterium]|nr:SDR family oxidoreductase [Oligoflexia bacterium]
MAFKAMKVSEKSQHHNNVVLVTGGSSGIGLATAKKFSNSNYTVGIIGRSGYRLELALKELGPQCFGIEADLSRPEAPAIIKKEVQRRALKCSVLVNNAGIYLPKTFAETTHAEWEQILQTNLLGPVRLTHDLLSELQGGAVIINVASTAGLRPIAGMAAYATSKAALISMTQILALELASKKIRVHAVCPGVVDTPIHWNGQEPNKKEKEKLLEQWASWHPLQTYGKPEDVAWAIYQLAQTEAHWMTGVVLPVDGGINLT